MLTVGNGAISFVRRDKGLMSQRDYAVCSIPIDAIRAMDVEQNWRRRTLVVTVDNLRIPGIPRHEFEVEDPYYWMRAVKAEVDEMATKSSQAAQPVQQAVVKEVVKEIVKYPCPYCDCLIEVTVHNCPSCGAPQRR